MTSDKETTAGAAGAGKTASRRRRNILLATILGVLLIDAIAVFVSPPQGADPSVPYAFPADAIRGNIEPIPPHVLLTLDGSEPNTTDMVLFQPSITSTILTLWIVMLVALVVVLAATRGRKEVPGPLQNAVEYAYESLSSFGMSIGGPQAKAFVPLFASLFVLIILCNWSGLVPPVGRVELLRAPTSDINVTFGLAVVSFFTFHVAGIRSLGVRGYVGKFFSLRAFRDGLAAGLISWFVGLMEFFLEFVKPVTLAMRLFGNIYGGEMALMVITSLTVAVIPIALVALETFVGFVQALIFSVLTLIFTVIAVEGHHDEPEAVHDAVEEMPLGNIPPVREAVVSGSAAA